MLKDFVARLMWALIDRGRGRTIPRNIGDRSEPYLHRGILFRRRLLGCFIHNLVAPDPDGVHCHPWDNVTVVLFGGYREYGADGTVKDRGPGSVVYRRAEQFHRLEPWAGGAWTLFFIGRKRRKWGFLPAENGWYPHRSNMTEDV